MVSHFTAAVVVGLALFGFLLTLLVPVKGNVKALFHKAAAGDDEFVSARSSQGWFSIGSSLYVTAVGTWCLTAPPEASVEGGFWGFFGYALACVLPWMFFMVTGPIILRTMHNRGFTFVEFVSERFGRALQLCTAIVSLWTLFVSVTGELVAIATAVESLVPGFSRLAVTISVAVVANVYSVIGGLPATLVADRLTAALTTILSIICYAAITVIVVPKIHSSTWIPALAFDSGEGFVVGMVFVVSCFFVEQLNPSTWQRVFAARSAKELRNGFGFAVILMFLSMLMFGFAGTIALAAAKSGVVDLDMEAPYRAVFLLVSLLPAGWKILVIVLAIGLVTSTANSVQLGFAALAAGEIVNQGWPLYWSIVFSVAVNIPAIVWASMYPPSILMLYMLGNVVTMALAPAVFLGFWSLVTPTGAIWGFVAGLIVVPIQGWIFTRNLIGALFWVTFPERYDWRCLVTLIVVILTSVGVTVGVSWLQVKQSPNVRMEQATKLAKIFRLSHDNSLDVAQPLTKSSSVATSYGSSLGSSGKPIGRVGKNSLISSVV